MPDTKIIRAMFDIKPVNQSGGIDIEKINTVSQKVDLKKSQIQIKAEPVRLNDSREELVKELNRELKKKTSLKTVLAKIGGSIVSAPASPVAYWRRPVILQPKKSSLKTVLPKTEHSVLDVGVKERIWRRTAVPAPKLSPIETRAFWHVPEVQVSEVPLLETEPSRPNLEGRKKYLMGGAVLTAVVLAIIGFSHQGSFQEKVVKDSQTAVENLENAKTDIKEFNFGSAAQNFSLAYNNFSNASGRLNLFGSAFSSFLGEIPGFGQLKSARNLTEAGENIAKAGESLSLAVDNLSKTNFVSYFALSGKPEKSLSDFINSFRDSLVFARKKFQTANVLLSAVDGQIIPEEKRQDFLDFREQLPLFEKFLDGSLDYADFLLGLVGQSGPKKYLLLFENNTELRAAGGFIGSYALVDFSRGYLRNLEVKDVYETDGQAKKDIIPPKELQHITPVWGMRDANWFVNFPDSAKKVMQLYTENDGGPVVDGVIALTPTVISKILAVSGPVELAEYDLTIDSGNFLAEIQEEVEYGPNRAKPKQILVDFAPRFLEKLGQLDKEKWAEIFKILNEAAEQKQILAYFKNASMEKVVVEGGFGGEIKSTTQDYLAVFHSNVKGSKTDAYIDNIYDLKSEINARGMVEHTLSVSRKHRGGKTGFGFYNRVNYDYLRVLVPKGSKLLEINGQSGGNFVPIEDYDNAEGFVTDPDLSAYEKKAEQIKPGVKRLEEAGKTVFGFWMTIEPGQTKTVTLKYETPVSLNDGSYSLLVQKQPGTLEDTFNFSFALPEGKQVIYRSPELSQSGSFLKLQTKLLKDATAEIKFQ